MLLGLFLWMSIFGDDTPKIDIHINNILVLPPFASGPFP